MRDVVAYANAVADNFRQRVAAQPEDQLKAPVGELLQAMGRIMGRSVNYRTEVRPDDLEGRPDIGVTADGLLIGLVELKAPGVGAQPETFRGRNAEQWERFKQFPNLVYTDGAEWSLYQNGELASRVRISEDIERGARAVVPGERGALETLFRAFLDWGPTAPSTAEGLAAYLAPLTRILRDEVSASLDRPNSPLRDLANEWADLLFPEGGDAQFADAYAQTLTYALLLARFEGAERLTPAFASEALQRKYGLLSRAISLIQDVTVRDEIIMPVQLLERAIGAVDAPRLNRQGDPWIYFYEQFLGAYDMRLRNSRGVYYTPVEVVQAQTRLASELLRTRFGKQDSFADDDVNVLDPATGTGAYLLSVLDDAADVVSRHYGSGAVSELLAKLAQRLFGFEILVGPYAVAHLRVTQRLREANVDDVPRIYLTDTLESPHHPPELRGRMRNEINQERERAQGVKQNTRILVCIGNPPYDRDNRAPSENTGSKRKGGWVRYGNGNGAANGKKNGNGNGNGANGGAPILEDFLAPVRTAGGGVHLTNLYNDYVYFWRWALWKVFEGVGGDDGGIVSFITASSYLRGPAFAGMRRKMREAFDELWIIDLEGDSLGARKTENVFAIQTPVAIAIGVRDGEPNLAEPAKVWKVRLMGSAKEKLARLDEMRSFASAQWQPCSNEWDAPLHPAGEGGYFDWPKATDVFPWQASGVKMGRTWPIGVTSGVLEFRWSSLLSRPRSERAATFSETRDRKAANQYPPLAGDGEREPAIADLPADAPAPSITRYAYRSFDRQRLLADSRLGDSVRPEMWRAHGPKQVYLTSLLTSVLGEGPAATASADVPDLHHFCGRGAKDVVPLWRDAEGTEPNVTDGLLARLSDEYRAEVPPERLFAYAYGVLAQPAYVKLFWDELELPPLRLPITKDAALFNRAADLGARLLGIHAYGERYGEGASNGAAQCVKQVMAYPTGHSYDPGTRTLRVGDGEFSPVEPEVWNYAVSGMQVVKSWLDRRKRDPVGRKSSPLDEIGPEQWNFTQELLALLWALEATIALQPEGAALLEEICAGPLFAASELPSPSAAERRPPDVNAAQAAF